MHICIPFNKTLLYDETGANFNSTIRFFPFMTLPFVVYNTAKDDIKAEVYQICGPFILMLTNFARKLNAR